MCAIFGALLPARNRQQNRQANAIMSHIMRKSRERGRDGEGHIFNSGGFLYGSRNVERNVNWKAPSEPFETETRGVFIGNMRAEPTTEFVASKVRSDQQPYFLGGWAIVHNGTIANDKALRTFEYPSAIDSATIVELLASNSDIPSDEAFFDSIRRLKGSYAILATNTKEPEVVWVAANYRPIWYAMVESVGTFFASSREYFPKGITPTMLEPYTMGVFSVKADGGFHYRGESLHPTVKPSRQRALVVCSGGLDSVVAATHCIKVKGYQTDLLHFQYGSRAEGPEVTAVQAVAKALGVGCHLFPLPVYSPTDSPLLQASSGLAGGEEGAEFAHEWVPARNLVLLSVATAYAEANGYDYLVLGNNLEEAGAYPDNEPEFIAKFNDLLPFAVGDGKRLKVIMPVGNMMKHEIVQLGHMLGAPMDKTWSCYRAGELHCGKCGPCFMRRKAFEINGIPEVITYEDGKDV